MILAYTIIFRERHELAVQTVAADVRAGAALGRSVYPCMPRETLKDPPTSVSLQPLDRRILMKLIMHSTARGHEILFSGSDAFVMVSDMIRTGRCYLWHERGLPLKWGKARKAAPSWSEDAASGLLATTFELAGPLCALPCAPPVYLDVENRTCGEIASGLDERAAYRWQRAAPMTPDQAPVFFERLSREFPKIRLPAPPRIETRLLEDFVPVPVLSVMRGKTDESSGSEPLLARLEFQYGQVAVAEDDPRERVRFLNGTTLIDIARQPEREQTVLQCLRHYRLMPCVATANDLFERARQSVALALAEDAPAGWAELLTQVFPKWEKEGWIIRHEKGCAPFAVADEDWYSDLAATGKGWFTFEAGFVVDGERINLLPHVHAYLRRHREWSQADYEANLRGSTVPVFAGDRVALLSGDRFFLILKNRGALDRPCLVVAPTSVVGNWRAELERFAPSLRVTVMHGPQRHEQVDALLAPLGGKGD